MSWPCVTGVFRRDAREEFLCCQLLQHRAKQQPLRQPHSRLLLQKGIWSEAPDLSRRFVGPSLS